MIRRETAYSDISEILPHFLNAAWIRPVHPTYPNSTGNLFQFKWGEIPDSCDNGMSIVYAYPVSSRSDIRNNSTDRFTISFRLGITIENQSILTLCQDYHMRLKHALFSPGGEKVRISEDVTFKGQTLACPNLNDFGVHSVKAYGPDTYAQIKGNECNMWTFQMLVEWVVYVRSYRLLRT